MDGKKKAILFALALFGATIGSFGQVVTQFEFLGALDGIESTGNGVNQGGSVAGYFVKYTRETHAFAFFGGGMFDLGIPSGYTNSKGTAINDSGNLAAIISTVDSSNHPAFYDGSTFIDLGTFGGTNGEAYAINNSGVVVGYAETAQHFPQAFLWSGGGLTPIPGLGGKTSYAYAINDGGIIVGQAQTSTGDSHAFLYDGVSTVDLGTLGGSFSRGSGVNDRGQVTGYAANSQGAGRAFLYAGHGLTDLGTLGGRFSYGWAINDAGLVVGSAYVGEDPPPHAFLYVAGSMLDLNTMAGPMLSVGSILTSATSVSDTGWITGTGYCAESQTTEAWRMRVLPTLVGRVTLGWWIASPNGIPIHIKLSKGGQVVQVIDTTLDAAGDYSVVLNAWDTYDISVKAPHWLSVKQTDVPLGETAAIDWDLDGNGDMNGNDSVTFLDLAQILADYGSGAARSDANGDHSVSVLDLAAVLLNFGRVGGS